MIASAKPRYEPPPTGSALLGAGGAAEGSEARPPAEERAEVGGGWRRCRVHFRDSRCPSEPRPAGKALPDAHGPVGIERGVTARFTAGGKVVLVPRINPRPVRVRFRADGGRAVLLPSDGVSALLFLDTK